MNLDSWWALGAVFVGGAMPWLEAVVVIPAAIVAGISPVTAVLAAASGNALTVGVAAYAGEWIRERLAAWRDRRRALSAKRESPRRRATRRVRGLRRRNAIEKVMNRGGLPLLALVGPLGLGTQFSAIAAVAAGVSATRSFAWLAAGTIFWSIVAAILAVSGLQFLGIGA